MGDLEHIAAFLNATDGDAQLRTALRALVAGQRPAITVTAALAVDDTGRVVAVPDGAGSEVVVAVLAAQAAGSWPRLKLCAAEDCRHAFVDRSRNRSATWCSMATCGNRAKVMAFRARARARAAT
jgi:predicted RNA-binding Zn ribbon-like protein